MICLTPLNQPTDLPQFVEDQAIDRVHRLNQRVDVVVYKLTVAHTVEARILALQDKKRALAQAAIEGKAVAKLSLKDLLKLFRRDAEDQPDEKLDHKVGLLPKTTEKEQGRLQKETVGMGGARVAERVLEKRGVGKQREESVWSRRW